MKLILLLVFTLIFAGCAVHETVHTDVRDELNTANGLLRNRWWNHYERGISLAEEEFYDRAIHDLNSAIDQRTDDQWRSRTYGMHLIDYFPHRELGVIYYKLHKFNDAVRELEYSMRSSESAKAKYYLNKARKSLLEISGDDTFPPSIRIDHPTDGAITNRSAVTLNGRIEDDFYVSSLFINDIPYPIELAAKQIVLKQKIALKRGVNEITVRAADLTGKTTDKSLTIHNDREGPVIIIEDQFIKDRKVIISGLVTDNTRITSFLINGRSVPVNTLRRSSSGFSGEELEFRQEIDPPDGTGSISLSAEDAAGNITKGDLSARPSNTVPDPLPMMTSSSPVYVAFNRNDFHSLGSLPDKITGNLPPDIYIKNLEDHQTAYTDSLFIEGRVYDNSKIKSLTVNGESVLRRKGGNVFFTYLTDLREGKNVIHLEAVDLFGSKSERTVVVYREIPKVRQIGSRMSISILPMQRKGRDSLAAGTVYDGLISAFIDRKRFRLIERERIEDVLNELRLGQTELAEPGTASRIGRIILADAILVGTIHESRNAIEIFTRLIDTETSAVMDTQDVFDEDRSLPGIKRLMQGLALKYSQSFPLVEGHVIKKNGKTILTDLGKEDKIKENMGLIIFREGEKITHPFTEELLGSEFVGLGEAKIDEIYDHYSRAIMRKGDPADVRIEDMVITK